MAFKKGQSGNPNGRPKGSSKTRWDAELREALAEHASDIIDRLLISAKRGNPKAQKLYLDRVLPALKHQDRPVSLRLTGSLSEKGEAVIRALSAGKITPIEAEKIMGTLQTQARLVESSELVERLEALEQSISLMKKKDRCEA